MTTTFKVRTPAISSKGEALYGGEDDDTLAGGAGSDYLDGGSGKDVALLSGNSSDYSIAKGMTSTGEDLYYLTDNRDNSPDGVEQLTNIETLAFDDGELSLADFATEYGSLILMRQR